MIVGSGAQILGPIIIKSCARIGSNAVVTKDVPKGGIMVGIPAKNIQSKSKKQIILLHHMQLQKSNHLYIQN